MDHGGKEKRQEKREQSRKLVMEERITQARRERGLLIVLTGNGKGKSTSAFGMVARALGHGLQVGVAQFIKQRADTGEAMFFHRQPGVYWHLLGEGFTWESEDPERDRKAAQHGWSVACKMLKDSSIDLVVFDELTYPIRYGWLDLEAILFNIANRPPMQHVIITGRGAPPALCEVADTVTEMVDVKHAFHSGIKAQPGIDF